MGHAQQAAFLTRYRSVNASPEMRSAPANWLARKLRVGNAPTLLTMFISTAVPNSGNAWLVTGLAVSILRLSYSTKRKRSWSAIAGRAAPSTTMALRFLLPITAPGPPRARLRCPSFMMAAMRTRCSPAGPMHSTLRRFLSWPSRAVVSPTRRPHKWAASCSVTPWGVISSHTGLSARPRTTSASKPLFLNRMPQKPPELASSTVPVRGLLVLTVKRLLVW